MERWTLPEGWEWKPMLEVCDINPERPRIQRKDETLTSFIPMQAVDDRSGTIINIHTRPYSKVKRGYTYFEENDVLMAKITPSMENGKAAIARNLIDGIGFGTTEFHVFHPHSNILPEWIFYFIRRKVFRDTAKVSFRGAVGQQRVPEEFLLAQEIPLPFPDDPERSLAEQRRIVARLEALLGEVKALREQVQTMQRDVNRLMESALAEVFPSVGQPLPQGWGWKTINDLFDIQQGASMSPRRRHGTNPQLFLRTKNILWGEVDTTDLDKMDFTIDEIEKLKVRKGDLLICEGGDVGRTALWEEQIPLVLFQNHIHRLRHKDNNVEPKYYMYWMRFAYQVSKLYQGEESRTAIPNLSAGRLRNFIVPFTSIAEQRRIVAYLDGIQEEVREAQKLLEADLRAIEQLEQSILAAAFRGEL